MFVLQQFLATAIFFFVLCCIFCLPVSAAIALSIVSLILTCRRLLWSLLFKYSDSLLYSIVVLSNILRDGGGNYGLTLHIFFEALLAFIWQ